MKENSSGKKVAIRSDSDGIIASDRTDEELRKCESRHHAILQTAMDGFWLVNLQGRIMEVNEAYCKMSGYTSVELLTMSITDLDVKESRVDTAAHIQKIVVNGKDRFVSRQRHKNGSIFDVEVSVQFYQEAGVLFAFLRDVTASNRVEEDLRKNEALMRTALKNLPIIFYMIDRDGIFRLSIGAGLKGLGLEQNQVVGLSAFDVYKDFPEITDSIKTTLSGKAATFETTVSGSTYFNTCVPFFTPSKEFSGLVAVALDITEIKKAETALTQSEDRFRRAIENAPFPIMLHAENGEVLALSEGWTHDSGYTIDDIPTTSIWSERAYGTKKQIVKEE